MRYVIYGAGAIGATIGARLFEAGRDVTLIARGAHLEALQSTGLTFADPDRSRVLPIPAVGDPSEIDWKDDDVVILGMKTQDTFAAVRALAASAPPSLRVVCAQNGVANERIALRYFENVYAMCVMLPATHLDPGLVEAQSLPVVGILDLGRYPSGNDDDAAAIAADLRESGFSSEARPDAMRAKYAKLLMNLGNSLDAACGREARRSDLYTRARDEAIACLDAAGIDYASAEEDRERRGNIMQMRPVEGRPRGGSSSWQSLARNTGSIETDYLNGEIVLLGRLHGIPVPVNALLQRVATRMARERMAPGSITLAELEAELPNSLQ